MFLQTDDYRVVCAPTDLEIISQSNEEIRQQAEDTAKEEVSGYVRSRFDIAEAYEASGTDRNPLLVQLTVSIALYYLGMWLPSFMGNDTREVLYNNAIARLRDIQKGAFTPDFPRYTDEDAGGKTQGDSVRFGSMRPNKYDY